MARKGALLYLASVLVLLSCQTSRIKERQKTTDHSPPAVAPYKSLKADAQDYLLSTQDSKDENPELTKAAKAIIENDFDEKSVDELVHDLRYQLAQRDAQVNALVALTNDMLSRIGKDPESDPLPTSPSQASQIGPILGYTAGALFFASGGITLLVNWRKNGRLPLSPAEERSFRKQLDISRKAERDADRALSDLIQAPYPERINVALDIMGTRIVDPTMPADQRALLFEEVTRDPNRQAIVDRLREIRDRMALPQTPEVIAAQERDVAALEEMIERNPGQPIVEELAAQRAANPAAEPGWIASSVNAGRSAASASLGWVADGIELLTRPVRAPIEGAASYVLPEAVSSRLHRVAEAATRRSAGLAARVTFLEQQSREMLVAIDDLNRADTANKERLKAKAVSVLDKISDTANRQYEEALAKQEERSAELEGKVIAQQDALEKRRAAEMQKQEEYRKAVQATRDADVNAAKGRETYNNEVLSNRLSIVMLFVGVAATATTAAAQKLKLSESGQNKPGARFINALGKVAYAGNEPQ